MGIERVALIFDNLFRPETTGVYCLRALRELVHVEHFLPQNLDRIPRSGFDLYLNIDDGLHYRLPAELRPSAWWAIDTHMDPLWAAEKGRDFDWLFAAQRDGTERLRQGGINAHWLPLACDPAIHKPHALSKYWDVCFVGRVSPGAREDLLVLIRRNFPNSFAGQRYFEEYAKTVSQSRVGFNRSIKNDVNMRVFETLGCGTLLMTNDLRENGQEELLMSDRHFVTYRGPEELVDKLHFYLRHDDARERIAQAGHAEAVARHTYRCRMQSLLESIQERRTIQAVRGPPPHDASETAAGRKAQPAGHRSGSPQSENDPAAEARPSDSRPAGWLDSIDFIVKTFLRPQALLRLLRSVSQHYPDARLTIADDGNLRQSEDADSRACCALIDENERFVLHTLPFATGVTPGRNLLVDKTDRPFLLLLDDDFCFNAETRIERLWERLNADPEVGVVAGACIDVVENERRPRNSGGTLDIQGDTLIVDTASWRDRDAGLRDYVPQFALVRREIFRDVRWEGGLGAEHYDFCLQLHDSKWKVAQDVSVQIDHFHFTPALPGYVERRFDFAEAQQWLLRKWNLRRLVQDGQVIVEQVPPLEPELIIPGSRNPHIKTPVAAGSVEAMLPVKDLSYFEFPRPEVVALVPESARRVLDIGCGAGRLGALIKERQPAEVTGIEFQPQAAALARQRLDRVLEQNVEDSMLDFPTGRFDCVVCADILEHLREPAQLLQKIRRWLSADGCLVASLPNTRHHSVVSALLEGNWTYEAAGLLDGDHVRFFTRREIEKLLYRQGFEMQTFQAKPGPGYDEWASAGRLGEVRVGPLNVGGLTP
ncbi:MAG TPA: glycosyltransferase, partial [Planctomycetaceae bacterium]|nr:glycosyltransferase [Planctomycetaceae bacterium]